MTTLREAHAKVLNTLQEELATWKASSQQGCADYLVLSRQVDDLAKAKVSADAEITALEGLKAKIDEEWLRADAEKASLKQALATAQAEGTFSIFPCVLSSLSYPYMLSPSFPSQYLH